MIHYTLTATLIRGVVLHRESRNYTVTQYETHVGDVVGDVVRSWSYLKGVWVGGWSAGGRFKSKSQMPSNRTERCMLARDVVLFPGPICAMFFSFQPSVTALALS